MTEDLRRRMFYLDGDRQMVRELDGSAHEAEPNDPELLAAAEHLRQHLVLEAAEAVGDVHRALGLPRSAKLVVDERGARVEAELRAPQEELDHVAAALSEIADRTPDNDRPGVMTWKLR